MPRAGGNNYHRGDGLSEGTTLEEAYRVWMEERRKQVTAATADRYEYLLERFILPELGGISVAQIPPARVGALAASLTDPKECGTPISDSVAETLLALTNSIIAFTKGDAEAAAVFRDKKQQGTKRSCVVPLSSEEIRRLVSCARYNRSPEMLGVLMTLYTGIGTGELCALSWDDFDLPRREITIRHTLYRVKNKDGGEKRTRLSVTNVRKSAMRTVQYPQELDGYVREFYRKGMVFLTGERNRYEEQRTLCNRLERVLELYKMGDTTLQRVKKTYDAGLADVRYLTDPSFEKAAGTRAQVQNELDERWLIKEMKNDLLSLRSILGMSAKDMGKVVAIPEADYKALENGETDMGWDVFLSLLFFFKYNSKTEGVIDALGLYPNALRERIEFGG